MPKNKIYSVETKNNKKVYYLSEKSFWYPLAKSEVSQIKEVVFYDETEDVYKINVYFGKQLIFSQKLYTI